MHCINVFLSCQDCALSHIIFILGAKTCVDKFQWCANIGTFNCNNPFTRANCRKRCGVCKDSNKNKRANDRTSGKCLNIQMKKKNNLIIVGFLLINVP